MGKVYLNTIALGSLPIWYLGWEHQIGGWMGLQSALDGVQGFLFATFYILPATRFFAVVRARGIWISHVIWKQ